VPNSADLEVERWRIMRTILINMDHLRLWKMIMAVVMTIMTPNLRYKTMYLQPCFPECTFSLVYYIYVRNKSIFIIRGANIITWIMYLKFVFFLFTFSRNFGKLKRNTNFSITHKEKKKENEMCISILLSWLAGSHNHIA